jgi:hypothetical protein
LIVDKTIGDDKWVKKLWSLMTQLILSEWSKSF